MSTSAKFLNNVANVFGKVAVGALLVTTTFMNNGCTEKNDATTPKPVVPIAKAPLVTVSVTKDIGEVPIINFSYVAIMADPSNPADPALNVSFPAQISAGRIDVHERNPLGLKVSAEITAAKDQNIAAITRQGYVDESNKTRFNTQIRLIDPSVMTLTAENGATFGEALKINSLGDTLEKITKVTVRTKEFLYNGFFHRNLTNPNDPKSFELTVINGLNAPLIKQRQLNARLNN
jgi:hypothetical protein